MKILHIWDMAGVSCILAKYQKRLGHDAKVIGRTLHDPLGFLEFYNEDGVSLGGKGFYKYCLKEAEKHDIIHIHSLPQFTSKFKKLGKKIILHYHGADAAKGKADADVVIIANKNLDQFIDNAIFVPNPIDTEVFKPDFKNRNKDALTFKLRYNDIEKFKEYTKSLNKKIDIIDRDENPIKYKDMPQKLNQYKTYVDVKFDSVYGEKVVNAMSKTGLEALSCGLEVINWELKSINEFPKEHNPYNVSEKMLKIYE